jgi:hypothetical protein
MRKSSAWVTAATLLLMCVFAASAQATPTTFTSSNVTSPADGSLLFQDWDANPGATITVAGTTNWAATGGSNLFDIACYNGSAPPYPSDVYQGPGNLGLGLDPGGNFSVTMPQDYFGGQSCHLVVVPHGTAPVPGTSFTGPRVGFSFVTYDAAAGGSRQTVNDGFNDSTTQAADGGNSSGYCGGIMALVDATSAMNRAPLVFSCEGSFLTSTPSTVTRWQGMDLPVLNMDANVDLTRSEIEVDGQNAYGSSGAEFLFTGSDALPNFPTLSFNVDSFSTINGDAQTTESEQLVKCTPQDVFAPTYANCTAFASTGVAFKRVNDYTNGGRVITVTDTFTSTDGQAHALDLQYETELGNAAAGWQFPGQSGYSYTAGTSGPAATAAPATIYAIDNPTASPSLSNPVGAATFAVPYNSVKFDDTIWGPSTPSTLFDFQRTVPASGSTEITWSYAEGTSLTEAQGYAAAARAAMQPPVVAISSPGGTVTRTPAGVTVTASAPSGVSSVTVNGVAAFAYGGVWLASVPLTRGQNTLTATAASGDGSTRSATATVTYAPPPKISLISKRFNGKTLTVKLACASSGSDCQGNVTMRHPETVVKHHKHHRVTAVIAMKHYAITYGRTGTVTATLNGTGRKLLEKLGKLAAGGTVTVTEAGGNSKSAVTFRLTLT